MVIYNGRPYLKSNPGDDQMLTSKTIKISLELIVALELHLSFNSYRQNNDMMSTRFHLVKMLATLPEKLICI